MTIIDTELEQILNELLQKNLAFYINNKLIKKGKLILYKQNNFHIEFTIIKDNQDIKRFEIPIPFGTECWTDGIVYFDYRLYTLANKDNKLYKILSNLDYNNKNKFYNKILEIKELDNK